MRARVKADGPNWPVMAFGGLAFVKSEWRDVPEGCEAEATNDPYLEVEPVDGVVGATGAGDPIPPAPDPQPAPEQKKPRKRAARGE